MYLKIKLLYKKTFLFLLDQKGNNRNIFVMILRTFGIIFWFLDPEIQNSRYPGIPWICLLFAEFNIQDIFHTQFLSKTLISMPNFKITSFIESSWNYLYLWNSSGYSISFAKFAILGMNSTWFLKLNLNLTPQTEEI